MNRVRQAPDVIAVRTILLVALAATAVFALGILWAALLQYRRLGTLQTPQHGVTEAGRVEIGLVFQPTFATSHIAEQRNARARERLERFGYTDSRKSTAFIPIERAKQLIVERGKL